MSEVEVRGFLVVPSVVDQPTADTSVAYGEFHTISGNLVVPTVATPVIVDIEVGSGEYFPDIGKNLLYVPHIDDPEISGIDVIYGEYHQYDNYLNVPNIPDSALISVDVVSGEHHLIDHELVVPTIPYVYELIEDLECFSLYSTDVFPTYATIWGKVSGNVGRDIEYRFRYAILGQEWVETEWKELVDIDVPFSAYIDSLEPFSNYVFQLQARLNFDGNWTQETNWSDSSYFYTAYRFSLVRTSSYDNVDSFGTIRRYKLDEYRSLRDRLSTLSLSSSVRRTSSSLVSALIVESGLFVLDGLSEEYALDTPIKVGKGFVIASCRSNSDRVDDGYARVELIDVVDGEYTKIRATRIASGGTCWVEWQTVSSSEFTVQSGVLDFGGGGTTRTIDISEVDLSKAFITLSATGGTTWIRRSAVRARFISSNQIEFYAEVSSTLYPTICWYVVEWRDASVHSGLVSVTGDTVTDEIQEINSDKTFLIFNYATTAETSGATALIRGRFSSNTQVEFARGSSSYACYVSYFCITHPDINVISGLVDFDGTSGSVEGDKRFLPTHQFGNAYSTTTGFSSSLSTVTKSSGDGNEIVFERANDVGTLHSSWFAVDLYIARGSQFSSVRKLGNVVTEMKSTARKISYIFSPQLFRTFRGFLAEYFGRTIKRSSLDFKERFKSARLLANYVSMSWASLRFPSISYLLFYKTTRYFKAEFFGVAVRNVNKLLTESFVSNRKLISFVVNKFFTTRRISIAIEHIVSILRQFSVVYNAVLGRAVVLNQSYEGLTNRRLSSAFVDGFKVLRFPSIAFVWVGATFRRVGELCIDLINRVIFPPKE